MYNSNVYVEIDVMIVSYKLNTDKPNLQTNFFGINQF